MTALLLLHLIGALAAPVLVRWWGRQAFLALALVPASAFAWLLVQLGVVLDGGTVAETVPWIPALELDVALRLDALALLFAALVTGVGALVCLYCAR
ncbi:MAG: Na+/H+ antiporter subunit A, partial [Actinomycetota bacterium]|nr:Na+/H+ antiporter subunit A [Actinomycetota bacterium]